MWVNRRWQLGAALVASMVAVGGCSDSAGGGTTDPDGGDAGDNNTGNNGTTVEPTTTVKLEDGTAGKACTSTAQCAGEGTECLSTFETGGMIGTILLGGAPDAEGGYCSGTCTADTQCGKGGACIGAVGFAELLELDGQCEQLCSKDADCRDGYECVSLGAVLEELDPEMLPEETANMLPEGGIPDLPEIPTTCRPKPNTAKLGDGVAGKGCEAASDCKGMNTTCSESIGGLQGFGSTQTPGGYCSGACADDSHCGEGGVCVGAIPSIVTGYCAAGCESDTDCPRDGYRCRAETLLRPAACLPAPDRLDDGVAGTACTGDADCGNGTCTTSLGDTTLGEDAFCSQACELDDDCGEGGVCYGLGPRYCVEACDSTAPACSRTGFTCDPSPLGEAAPDFCVVTMMATQEPVTCDPGCGENAACDEGTCACDDGFEGDPAAGCTAVATETDAGAEETDAGAETETDAAP